jgi:aminopeptidase N
VGESLSAHELAHQWFGDKITCGSWQDIWLNEGFATHLASMFMEGKYPDSILAWRKREIDRITDDPSGSVKVDDTNNVNRIFSSRLSYIKGSHLLYMLRFKLGSELFFKAIRSYQKDPLLVHSFAKTNDLKRNLEKEYGAPLDSFFRQWFEGQGHPSYEVQWAQIGFETVKIRMKQKTSHSSVSFFEMPVALKFKNATQEKTVMVDFKKDGQTFVEQIGFIADTVIVDPDYWLISKNNKTEKLMEIESSTLNFVVYPNPFKDQFSILIQRFKSKSVQIKLYDIIGRTVFSKQVELYKGGELISVPTTGLVAGKYLLTVTDETGIPSTITLLKQ